MAALGILAITSIRVHSGEPPYAARFLVDLRNHVLNLGYRTSYATGDFNGDGFGDLAIGIPFATVAGQRAAGKVVVVFGDHDGLTDRMETFDQNSEGRFRVPDANEAGDLIGFALAAADFNGDGTVDLAVGAPGQDLARDDFWANGIDAGAVFVGHGVAGLGLDFSNPGARYTQDAKGGSGRFDLAGDMVPGSLLGFSLAAGDFNGDGRTDLAVGIPGKGYRVGGTKDIRYNAGAVLVITGADEGLWGDGGAMPFAQAEFTEWGPRNYNLAGEGASNDCVGFSLAAGDFDHDGFDDLAIGAPGQNVGPRAESGAVKAARGTADGLDARAFPASYVAGGQGRYRLAGATQTGAVLGFSLAAADFNGDDRDDLAIGVPGRNVAIVGVIRSAGAVVVAAGSDPGQGGEPILDGSAYTAEFTQSADDDRYDLPGSASEKALVGFSLAAGDFDFSTLSRRSDLAIGAPGVNVAAQSNRPERFAGAVFVRSGSNDGGLASALQPLMLSQSGATGQSDLWDIAESGDNVGMTVAAGPLGAGAVSDLMIAVPEERFPNLTLGVRLAAPFDQMTVDAMTHVVYGQEGVGLDARQERPLAFPRFARGVQFDPAVVRREFQSAMQLTQPIVGEDWVLHYAAIEIRFERSSDSRLPDRLYTDTTYVERGAVFHDVKGYGVLSPDEAGVLLQVNAVYEDFGRQYVAQRMPAWNRDWGKPLQVILLPNFAAESIFEP